MILIKNLVNFQNLLQAESNRSYFSSIFCGDFMKGQSTRLSLPRSCVRHVLFPVVIVVVCLWLYCLVYVMQLKESKHQDEPYQISSYTLSTQAYRDSIRSIAYDKTVLQMSHSDPPKPVQYFTLKELMTAWDLDDTSSDGWLNSPAHPAKGKSVPRFDMLDPKQQKLAESYRNMEIPCILYNVPQLDRAAANTFTTTKLLSNFGTKTHSIEKSASNRFMYYHRKKSLLRNYPSWIPPQEDIPLSFPDFLTQVEIAESFSDTNRRHPLLYLSISAEEVRRHSCLLF